MTLPPYTAIILSQSPPSKFDLNGDGIVNGADLGILLSGWGPCGTGPCAADINRDGRVDGSDLGLLLSAWGSCAQ